MGDSNPRQVFISHSSSERPHAEGPSLYKTLSRVGLASLPDGMALFMIGSEASATDLRVETIPEDFDERVDALLAGIAEDRRHMEADAAVIAHLSRQADERMDRIARQLDEMAAGR